MGVASYDRLMRVLLASVSLWLRSACVIVCLFVTSQVILDDDVEEDGDGKEGDEEVELDGDAKEDAQDEGHRCSEALQQTKVLEGQLSFVRTAQVHQICK